MFQNPTNKKGQSEVLGEILMIAMLFMFAAVGGSFYLTFYASSSPAPAASVEYDISLESGTGNYLITVEPESMERADQLVVYYNSSDNQVGTINDISDSATVGDGPEIIQDDDRLFIVADYNDNRQVISKYTFDEAQYLENRDN